MAPRAPRTDGKPKGSRIEKGKSAAVTRVVAATPSGGSLGAPTVVIDEIALYQLALTHASFEHMGRILGVSGMLLSDVNKPHRAIIERARAQKKTDLLAAQFDTAITGRNPTMQIWLGKQYLGQKDVQRVETTGPDGKPQQLEVTAKAVAYFPVNNRNKRVQATLTHADGSNEDVEAELEDATEE